MFEVFRKVNLCVRLLLLLFSYCCCHEVRNFISPPTTVKARENNTVLLPCYLNTLSNGKFFCAPKFETCESCGFSKVLLLNLN